MQKYLHGHAPQELERLAKQAVLIDPITRAGLLNAGLGPGMRVLDVGSGAGDTAFLAAEIVGSEGEVVGTDRSPLALEAARARAAEKGAANVSFLVGDPAELSFESPFDAAVGRYVLMFQNEPAAMLRGVAAHVRPGGILAFHEPDWAGARSLPACPTYDRCCDWLREVVSRSGARRRMGVEMTAVCMEAGLPAPEFNMDHLMGGGERAQLPIQLVTDLLTNLIEELEQYGIARRSEIGPDDLYDRMTREAVELRATVICRSEIVAWTFKPGLD